MFRRLLNCSLASRALPFSRISTRFFNNQHLNIGVKTSLFATTYLAFMPASINLQQQKQECTVDEKLANNEAVTPPKSFLSRLWHAIIHVVRFLHLLIIFMPPMLTLPLLLSKRTQKYWMDIFVKAIERAGVVFIKAFQYLSHRRDIIGPEMAAKFEYLRQNAPTHSLETTKANFKQAYGRNVEDIFQEFNPIPIASGSVSQVYKAIYKGKKVAVKVRHPNVDKYIERDVNLLFFLSYLASFISPAMEIPVSEHSLKKTLTQQLDFTFEMKNLNTFNKMFEARNDIKFPFPFEQNTKDSVLIETFVEGVPVTYYENNKHPLNKVIARLGSTTFFEMLMKNNFIHADCHGGNIFIEITEQSYNFLTEIRDSLKEVYYSLETKLHSWTFSSEKIKQLYVESRREEQDIRNLLRKYKEKIVVNLIDVGMVITLNQKDKKNFVNFIKSIIEGRGEICAELIYSLSNFEGKKILAGTFEKYHKQLTDLFSVVNNHELEHFKGMDLFVDMLTIIRQNKMKLDGEFATLLTNMMVLEAIAKDIDPEINILKCAFPYFKYVQDFGIYTK